MTPTHGRHLLRFNLYHRILHGMVIVSFLGLALTGLPLKYADLPVCSVIAHLLGGPMTARYLHRVLAIVTFLYFGLHLGYLARLVLKRTPGVFWGPNSMVPQPRDLFDLYDHLRYFMGLGQRPKFARFTYWEKFDYWAVFWGVGIIGTSGLVLWFSTFFGRYLPGWLFNVAFFIHSEEALLATSFIFTIHFFNSHLRPEKFPMDTVIFTGRVEEAEYRAEHESSYDDLAARGELEAAVTDEPQPWMLNFARVVGFCAVALGLSLAVLIAVATFH